LQKNFGAGRGFRWRRFAEWDGSNLSSDREFLPGARSTNAERTRCSDQLMLMKRFKGSRNDARRC
jgi:hypothetical protein